MAKEDKTQSAHHPDESGTPFDERLGANLWTLAREIARTTGRYPLYFLVAAITVVIIATAASQVWLNAWNEPFYNAIQQKNVDAFIKQLGVFFGIAAVLLVLNVSQRGLDRAIRLKLREMATKDLISHWMRDKHAARISRLGHIGVNPDQRIHEDTNHLTELTTDLGIGLLQATLLLVSFIGVLWELSRGFILHIADHAIPIPGYMVWAALIYAATGSWFSWLVGRRLVSLQRTRYAREANLRIALVRSNEQADGIVLTNGEADERQRLEGELGTLLETLRKIVIATVRLTWVTAGYGWIALVFPIIVAAPGYFSGALSFGELMMVVGAFNQVQTSLRWFVDNTDIIADWRATLLRVMTFRSALLEIDNLEAGTERFDRSESTDGTVVLENLTVLSFRGRTQLQEARVEVTPGEHVMLRGQPGSGKSALFLAVAGLWNWGTGRISLPPAQSILYLSQHPFLPPGSLRAALTYSHKDRTFSDDDLRKALTRVGLDQLGTSLDREERWDKELTIHEQQLLALARIILLKPKWVISDETLDAIEESDRDLVISVFDNELVETGVISISGRPPHNGFYSRKIPVSAEPLTGPADIMTAASVDEDAIKPNMQGAAE